MFEKLRQFLFGKRKNKQNRDNRHELNRSSARYRRPNEPDNHYGGISYVDDWGLHRPDLKYGDALPPPIPPIEFDHTWTQTPEPPADFGGHHGHSDFSSGGYDSGGGGDSGDGDAGGGE